MKIFKNKKALQRNSKGLVIVWLPLVDSFRTFCWGEIIEEFQNIFKLKEFISIPTSSVNPI